MIDPLQSATARIGRMALDACIARHQVIAHNIANAGTEGFQPLRLNFEEQLRGLRSAIGAGASEARLKELTAGIHPYVEARESTGPLGDGTARIDEEMTLLVQNTVQYEAILTAMTRRGALLRTAINGSSL